MSFFLTGFAAAARRVPEYYEVPLVKLPLPGVKVPPRHTAHENVRLL